MENEKEIWAYDEPLESGGNVHITMTKLQAINWMEKVYPNLFQSLSDGKIFNEWVALHWAYKENQSGKGELT